MAVKKPQRPVGTPAPDSFKAADPAVKYQSMLD